MEIHMSRLASFTTNGDNLSQIQTGSSRRRSFTQDSFFRDMQGETPGRRSSLHTRPFSYNQKSSAMKSGNTKDNLHFSLENSNLRFGVIPQELHYRLLDLDDYKSRTIAIEELKYLIQDFDFSSVVHSDVVGLISFLCNLLDDKNFTVVHITLDVLNCLVINLAQGVDEFLPHVVASTVKVLGDSKITIKQEYMKIYMRLMKVVGPFKVLTILLEHLKHKYSRVREEVVNICIISLLTYPSEDFVLPFLACEIAPCLIDSKRKVRHAALEAFAVLAASMGPEKSSLLKAVDAVELLENGDGLMNAVQARLARKTLPRITPQGLIEYALPCPSSAQTRSTHHLPGADTNWLLTGNRVQSAQYHSGDHTGRNIVPHIDPVARRILSAGKGKNKLPWENQYPGVLDVFPGNPTPVVLQPEQCSSRFDGHHTPIVKTPIAKTKTSASNTSPENPTNNANQPAVPAGKNESPIRLKAAMVRVPSARKDLNRTRPVPPITKMAPLSPSNSIVTSNQANNQREITENTLEDEKLGIDLSDLCLKDDEEDDPEEMNSSLRNVRNSAAKKRAKMTGSLSDLDSPDSMKMELNLDSPTMTSSPTNVSYSESGVYSRESLASPTSPVLHMRQISDVTSIPKSKARPPRLPSPRNKDSYKKLEHHHQGTSTQEKPVRVVGQRMHYRNGIIDAEEDHTKEPSPGHTKHQPKDQQKPLKPMKGITGSASSFQQISSYDYDWTHSEGSVAIVGKGVFENPSPVSRTHSQSLYIAAEDQSAVKQNIQPPAGIYGRAVQQNNSTAEIDTKVTMSKSARDKMRQKKECSIKEIVEIKDSEKKDLVAKERLHHTDPSPVITEIWRSKSDCAENVVEISPPTLKRTSSLKHSPVQSQYRDRKPSITRSSEVIDSSVLKELNKPEISVTEALRLMSDDDWEKKIGGLTLVRSLSTFHSHLVIERLHDLKLAVTHEVKNLRSSVSRAAIICLGDMFIYFKKNMDYELDNCVRVLLHKAGEPNTFIREDVDKALNAMVQNVTPVRALTSLINGGLSHLNSVVRKCTAQHLSDLVERMGPGRILSGIKDITDRVLPAIVKFAQDGSQETRFYGRKMLHFLMSHPDFDKMLEKYISTKDLSYLKDLIRNIQQKGIGEIQDAPSARGRRSYHGSVSSLRASSVSQNTQSALER